MPNQPPRTSGDPKSELERVSWPELGDDILQILRGNGETRAFQTGDVLFDVGQDGYDFVYIERGAVEVLDRSNDHVIICVAAGNFMGELGMLMGQKTFLAADDKGFILTGHDAGEEVHGFATSMPGVYAVGDIRSGSVKRVASAVGEGSVVVSAVHGYLDTLRRGEAPS